MKTLIITVLFIVGVSNTFGQKCKYDKNEIDKFNGEVHRVVIVKIATLLEVLALTFERIGNDYSVSLYYSMPNVINETSTIDTESPLMILLSNDSIVELKTNKFTQQQRITVQSIDT